MTEYMNLSAIEAQETGRIIRPFLDGKALDLCYSYYGPSEPFIEGEGCVYVFERDKDGNIIVDEEHMPVAFEKKGMVKWEPIEDRLEIAP